MTGKERLAMTGVVVRNDAVTRWILHFVQNDKGAVSRSDDKTGLFSLFISVRVVGRALTIRVKRYII